MEANGLTQAEFAKAAKVNQSTVSRILRENPRRCKALKAICNYAGIELENAGDVRNGAKKAHYGYVHEDLGMAQTLHAGTVARIIVALQNVRLESTRTGGRLS